MSIKSEVIGAFWSCGGDSSLPQVKRAELPGLFIAGIREMWSLEDPESEVPQSVVELVDLGLKRQVDRMRDSLIAVRSDWLARRACRHDNPPKCAYWPGKASPAIRTPVVRLGECDHLVVQD